MVTDVRLDPDQYLHALDQKDRSGESQGGAPVSNRTEGRYNLVYWGSGKVLFLGS